MDRYPVGDTDAFRTPRALYSYYNKIYNFKADIAASDANHLHPFYYTLHGVKKERRNALSKDWSSDVPDALNNYVWLNHPYSDTGAWMAKAVEQARKGVGVVMLAKTPNAERYWLEYVNDYASELVFIIGRLKFGHPELQDTFIGNAPFGSTLVVWQPWLKRPSSGTRVEFVMRETILSEQN
jgi:phage N-6-adenine-methyltransferase